MSINHCCLKFTLCRFFLLGKFVKSNVFETVFTVLRLNGHFISFIYIGQISTYGRLAANFRPLGHQAARPSTADC